MREKKKKPISKLRLIFTAVLFLAVAVFAALSLKNGGPDLRKLTSRFSGEPASAFYYTGAAEGSFAAVGEGFAVLTTSELTVFDRSGAEKLSETLGFSNAHLASADGFGAAWEQDGSRILVFTEKGLSHEVEAAGPLVSVTVNARGYVAAVTEEAGYGGSVTVYNPNGKALYKWYSGGAYVITSRIRDRSELVSAAVGAGGSVISLHRLNDEEEKARYEYDGIVLDILLTDSGVAAVTDTELVFLSKTLEEKARWSYGGRNLTDYGAGDGFIAVALSDYQLGGTALLATVGYDGTEAAGETLPHLTDLAVSGQRIAALTDLTAVTWRTARLEERTELKAPAGAFRLMLGEESVIAAGAYSAQLLEPEKTGSTEEQGT